MLFVMLSALDLLAGAAIYSPAVFKIISGFVWTVAMLVVFKGIYTLACSFSEGYYFEWAGMLDLVAGITLALASYNIVLAPHIIGGLFLGKGVYYLTRSIIGI